MAQVQNHWLLITALGQLVVHRAVHGGTGRVNAGPARLWSLEGLSGHGLLQGLSNVVQVRHDVG